MLFSMFFRLSVVMSIFFFSHNFSIAQCTLVNNQGIDSGGNGQLANNSNFNNQNEQYWSTGNQTIGNLNLSNNGSITVVSGTLTIQNANFNGNGTIIVRSGATLTFEQQINIGQNYTIINYGTINTQNVNVNGPNVWIYNHPGATINVASNRSFHLNNGTIVNDGLLDMGELRIQTNFAPSVCLLENSTVNLINFYNNTANSITGQFLSCMHIETGYHLNQNVSPTEDLLVCRATGSTQTAGSADFGDATNFQDCDDCSAARAIALPVALTSFSATCNENVSTLKWITASELNASHYDIQNSRDGLHWNTIATLNAAGTTNQTTNYKYDAPVFGGLTYFRLVQVDLNGKQEIYGPVSNVCDTRAVAKISAFPNPVENTLNIALDSKMDESNVTIELVDLFGRVVASKSVDLALGVTVVQFETAYLLSGTYMIRTNSRLNESAPIRVVKK
jgi:hypothetical protein